MLMHRSLDLTEVAQCSCFQQPFTKERLFLAKKTSFEKHLKTQFTTHIPEHVQDVLAKNSIKKSLKRGQKVKNGHPNAESPVRGSQILRTPTNSLQTFRQAKSCEGLSYRDSFPVTPPSIKITTISPPKLVESPRSPTPNVTFKRIQTNPTLLQIKEIPMEAPALSSLSKHPQINFTANRFSNNQPESTKLAQQQQNQEVGKAEKKSFGLKKKFSLNENHQEHKKLIRKLSQQKELSQLEIEEEHSIDLMDSMQMETPESPQTGYYGAKLAKANGRGSIFNSVPVDLKVHKSIIKEESNKNKVILHHRRRDFLNTMSEVEEVKSQADSNDFSESDKESVVIGNLGHLVRQNSVNFGMGIPQLSKGFQDNQSIESTVMSARLDRQNLSKLRDFII